MVRRLRRRLTLTVRPVIWRVAQPPEFLPPLAVQCIKVALGCGIAWFLGPYVGLPRPYNAVLAVIILMQGNAYGSLLSALQFLIGVGAGLLLGVVASHFEINALAMALIMFVCLLAGGLLKISSQGFNNQIAISALLVLASGTVSNVSRLWETVLGGVVGVLIAALLWPPNPIRGLRQRARELGAELSEDITASIELITGPSSESGRGESNRRRIRDHNEAADAAVAEVVPAQEALRWNPWHFRRTPDLSRIEDRLRLISYLYRSVRALARQAAEMVAAGVEAGEAAGPVRDAGRFVSEAVQARLTGHDATDLVAQGREAVAEFVRGAPRDHHALALAASLDALLSDVEGWSWDSEAGSVAGIRLIPRVLRRLGGDRLTSLGVVERAEVEFQEELGQGRVERLTEQLRGQPVKLPALEDVVAAAGVEREEDRGVRMIPLSRVRGVERPTRDFDASFLPRRGSIRDRWVRVFQEMEQKGSVDPIDVYQVGDAYFVRHGHTRVSVARHLGWLTIPAHVIDMETRAPIDEVNPEELLRASEYARFLEITELDHTRPQARLDCSELGRFDLILEHIEGHRYFLGERGRQVDLKEAAAGWYDSVYRPTMDAATHLGLGRRLPGWTETDIYLALTQVWLELELGGREAGPEAAAAALVEEEQPAQHLPRGVHPGPARRGLRARVTARRPLRPPPPDR